MVHKMKGTAPLSIYPCFAHIGGDLKREMKFEEIDWESWQAKERATLLFIILGDQILMIHKKVGLGAGKINAPGGRLEPGETPLEAAIREVREEICVTPSGVTKMGELRFQFMDGYSIHGYVFKANGYIGDPQETEEAIPMWFSANALPYEKMWADDRLWMPLLLEGKFFDARFLFEKEKMLGHRVRVIPC
jgi:8-oxo-dGTP diphosphatase